MRADCVTDTEDETEANPIVPVTVCVADAMPEIEAIFDTLGRVDAENDIVGVGDDCVVAVAMPPVNEAMDDTVRYTVSDAAYDTVTLDDNVCTIDCEEDGVRFAVPEN